MRTLRHPHIKLCALPSPLPTSILTHFTQLWSNINTDRRNLRPLIRWRRAIELDSKQAHDRTLGSPLLVTDHQRNRAVPEDRGKLPYPTPPLSRYPIYGGPHEAHSITQHPFFTTDLPRYLSRREMRLRLHGRRGMVPRCSHNALYPVLSPSTCKEDQNAFKAKFNASPSSSLPSSPSPTHDDFLIPPLLTKTQTLSS
ncbi:hypothetical protein BDQ17DRAFT_1330517 [Cyathus striatus]|nr:hypothetical protein BDQ17DRAFT_1330517 [Cyathus striatus]